MKKIRILKATINADPNQINYLENEAHKLINEGYQLFASHTEHSSTYAYLVMIFELYGDQGKESEQVISNVYTEN